MKTSDLAEDIKDYLNGLPPETWSGHKVGLEVTDYVHAENALDPILSFEVQRRGLYVIPVMSLYDRSTSQGRQKVVKLNKSPVIVICLSIPFLEVDPQGYDVASWENIKLLLNLREEIDEAIARYEWSTPIKTITVEQAQEIPMKQRWFLSITEFEFDSFTC